VGSLRIRIASCLGEVAEKVRVVADVLLSNTRESRSMAAFR